MITNFLKLIANLIFFICSTENVAEFFFALNRFLSWCERIHLSWWCQTHFYQIILIFHSIGIIFISYSIIPSLLKWYKTMTTRFILWWLSDIFNLFLLNVLSWDLRLPILYWTYYLFFNHCHPLFSILLGFNCCICKFITFMIKWVFLWVQRNSISILVFLSSDQKLWF